ncbi:hypothetical protein CYLTODRAFT_421079 [Cylindrobasidium torrendii FP15055 ss-10]|uniref:DUF6534 domain-containing protein n=1 Tax=Cylindrobasidium torrendii FP15055 ss-10 TaxID=1314674 RepID=A0A0D7BFP7_9AGAR|nr:hypothetical protein CYLTODRAFT_421079 [Cylindrobasidium torrendii FP15055 ss-10]
MSDAQSGAAGAMPPPEVIQGQVNLTVGAVLVGAIVSYLLLGVVLSGAWTYFSRYKNDTLSFRLLVGGTVSIAIIDSIMIARWAHMWGTKYWADMTMLDITPWECIVHFIFIGIVTLVVQWFYAWRIWIVSQRQNWWMPAIIVALSITWFGVYCWMVDSVRRAVQFSKLTNITNTVYVWLVCSVLADLGITAGMGYYLDLRYRLKRSSQHISSHDRFRAIVLRTVECNVLSLIAQIGVVVTYSRVTEVGMYFTLPGMTIVSIYTFSLIVSLNGRTVSQQMGMSDSSMGPASYVLDNRPRPPNHMSISIQQDTVHDHEAHMDQISTKEEDDFTAIQKVKLDSV